VSLEVSNILKALSFIFTIMIVSPLFSEPLPTISIPVVLTDFSGGLNTSAPASKIDITETPDIRNYYIDNDRLEKSKGFTLVGSTPTLDKVTKFFIFNKENGSKEFIVTDSSRVLTTTDFITFTLIRSGLSGTTVPDFFQLRNKVWCTNGVDAVFTWDGTTAQTLDGTSGTPDVPISKFGESFQERAFLWNGEGGASNLRFSSLVDTNAVNIAPDSFLAWPETNGRNVGQGDGQSGSAMWKQAGQLQLGKERSIYTLFGDDVYTYNVVPTNPGVGVVSDESVVFDQDIVYFFGSPPGFYAYDGRNVKRISDKIQPDMDSVVNNLAKIIGDTWDTRTEFATGGSFDGTTTTASGLLTLIPDAEATDTDGNETGIFTPTQEQDIRTIPELFQANATWHVSRISMTTSLEGCGGSGNRNAYLKVRNERTGFIIAGGTISVPASQTVSFSTFNVSDANNSFTSDDIRLSSFTIIGGWSPPTCTRIIFYASHTISLSANTTSQFISNVATIATITSWGTFQSERDIGDGDVDYFYRAATSAVNITTYPWIAVTPGLVIGATAAYTRIQWASTMTGTSEIDNVVINHNEGGIGDARPLGEFWKNRLWFAVSTQTTVDSNFIYVKSKSSSRNPYAFTLFDGINIKAIVNDANETLYGGSGSTGDFYKLDDGLTYNGTVFEAYYKTPQMDFGETFFRKKQSALFINCDRETSANLTVSYSNDGAAFTDIAFSINGTGRILKSLYGLKQSGFYFQYKFSNSESTDLKINSFSVLYTPTEILP